MNKNRLHLILDGGAIKRYHTKRTLMSQSVGEHSWRVAALCDHVTHGECSKNLLLAALYHDVSELMTGDVPSPAKWANPQLRTELNKVTNAFEVDNGLRYDLTTAEKAILRWADLADGALYCAEEIEMGNTTMYGTLRRYAQSLPLGSGAMHVGVVIQIRMREINDFVNLTLEANNDDSK